MVVLYFPFSSGDSLIEISFQIHTACLAAGAEASAEGVVASVLAVDWPDCSLVGVQPIMMIEHKRIMEKALFKYVMLIRFRIYNLTFFSYRYLFPNQGFTISF